MTAQAIRARRFDLSRVDATEVTPSGGLRIPARATRSGVLEYHDADGRTWGELRPADEVFSAESLASLRAATLTELHPPSLVSPETWKRLAVGHTGDDVRKDGEFVAVSVVVQDAETLARVRSGELVELSCGYSCDLDETPGVFDGKPYQRIQRGIRYNHVALGPEGWGRAGSDVRLHLDSGDAVSTPYSRVTPSDNTSASATASATATRERTAMAKTVKKDGDSEAPEMPKKDAEPAGSEAPDMTAKKDADLAAKDAMIEALKDALGDAMKKLIELEAASKPVEGESAITEEMVPEAVQDSIASKRIALWDTARAVLGNDTHNKPVKLDGKSAVEIKRMVVSHVFKSVKMDAKTTAETLNTLFDAATAQHAANAESAARADAKRADANKSITNVLAPTQEQAASVTREDGEHERDALKEQQARLKGLSRPSSVTSNTNTNAKGA